MAYVLVFHYFVLGETSSGKSTLLNLIIGQDILPTDITTCTRKVCRIKNAATLSVSTFNNRNEKDTHWKCKDFHEMADLLNTLMKTKEQNISYVDIELPIPMIQVNAFSIETWIYFLTWFTTIYYNMKSSINIHKWNKQHIIKNVPLEDINNYKAYINTLLDMFVLMLQGNVIFVDTPGIGDSSEEDVTNLLMDYLPNALAVVFILNVANAGGLQKDRVCLNNNTYIIYKRTHHNLIFNF